MKTIKELAQEIGVSKQAVRNEIRKQGLQSALQKNANQLCIPETAEKQIKAAFEKRRNANNFANTLQTETQTNFAFFQKELDAKNAQIERLQAENDALLKQNAELTTAVQNMTDSLKASQVLQAASGRLEDKTVKQSIWRRLWGK